MQKTTTYQNKHNISLSLSFTSSHTLLQIKEQLYSFEKYLNIMSKNWMLILIWPILQKYPFTLNIYLKNWTRFNKSLFSYKETVLQTLIFTVSATTKIGHEFIGRQSNIETRWNWSWRKLIGVCDVASKEWANWNGNSHRELKKTRESALSLPHWKQV